MVNGENPYVLAGRKANILSTLYTTDKDVIHPDYIAVREVYKLFPHIGNEDIDTSLDELDAEQSSPLDYYTANKINVCLRNPTETEAYISYLEKKASPDSGPWYEE